MLEIRWLCGLISVLFFIILFGLYCFYSSFCVFWQLSLNCYHKEQGSQEQIYKKIFRFGLCCPVLATVNNGTDFGYNDMDLFLSL